MTGLVCPHCDTAFESDKRVVRAEITECKLCQQKFVVTQNTLKAYQKPAIEAPVQSSPMNQPLKENLVKISCPHCSTELQGQISTGQIVECSDCHKQFEATPERLTHTPQVLSKAPTSAESASKKPKSKAGLLLAIAVGLIFLFSVFAPDSNNDYTAEAQPATTPAAATPEPVKDPNAPEGFLSAWDGSNRELVNLVKSAMNDPKSFEHVETRFIDRGNSLSLFMTYRGKNAFGGVVTNKVSAELDKNTRSLSNIQER